MPNYQVKITPLEYYFFGGEKHNEDLTTNYFVESNDYPQQSTLLGLVRYFLLQNNNLLGGKALPEIHRKAATELIGESSFDFNSNPQTFGTIKSISPLYFNDGTQNYYFAPLDILFDCGDNFLLSKNRDPYNAKDHFKLMQQNLIGANDNSLISLNSIIQSVYQVGNEKEQKENAFYKQNMKRLEKNWAFVIDVNIERDTVDNKEEEMEHKEYYLPFGGEKCFFKLSLKKQEAFIPTYPTKHQRNKPCLFCYGDCFIDSIEIKKLPFAVNNFISFRNLRSKITTGNFHALKEEKDIEKSMIRSDRYQLLQRGSVLYFNTAAERSEVKAIIDATHGSAIGFNKILINNIN